MLYSYIGCIRNTSPYERGSIVYIHNKHQMTSLVEVLNTGELYYIENHHLSVYQFRYKDVEFFLKDIPHLLDKFQREAAKLENTEIETTTTNQPPLFTEEEIAEIFPFTEEEWKKIKTNLYENPAFELVQHTSIDKKEDLDKFEFTKKPPVKIRRLI